MFSAKCNFWERSEVSSEWCKSSFRFRAAHSNNLISICNSKKRYLIPGTVHHSNQNSEKYNNEMRIICGHGGQGTATNDLDECPEQGQLRQFPYSVDHLDLQLPGTQGTHSLHDEWTTKDFSWTECLDSGHSLCGGCHLIEAEDRSLNPTNTNC